MIALVATLHTASVYVIPSDRACLRAASVSAVSPDCDTTTTSVAGSGTEIRERYSLAISTSVGTWAIDSIQLRATQPA